MMRYYVGLAVGHSYTHSQASSGADEVAADEAVTEDDQEFAVPDSHMATTVGVGSDSDESFDQDDLDWDNNSADSDDMSDEEAFLGMNEMYGIL